MSEHDTKGRPWAKLSELKEADVVELDNGFTCHKAGQAMIHVSATGEPYFICDEGNHDLSGQADDGEHCVGVYKLGA